MSVFLFISIFDEIYPAGEVGGASVQSFDGSKDIELDSDIRSVGHRAKLAWYSAVLR